MSKREKTKYPGVFFRSTERIGSIGLEKIYYIVFKKDGKVIEEKVGRQFADDMTPAKAAGIRAERIEGKRPSRKEIREEKKAAKQALENRWTVGRLWEEYKHGNPNLKGIVTDENRFTKHIAPAFGNKEPAEIDSLSVDRLRLKLLKTHTPGTVKNVMELFRRIINFGVKKNLCERLKFEITMPRLNNEKTEVLTPEQLDALLHAIDEEPNRQVANLMKMALFSGMRRGELFRLKWEDVDFDRGIIHIREPKGGIDQKIPLNQSSREILESHKRTGSPFVFPGRGGKQRVDIKKQVNRLKKKAGIPEDFRALHGLRHVYASLLASSGQVDLYTLQRLMTHKSPQMTQRYAHLQDEALQRASNVVGDVIGQMRETEAEKVVVLKKKGRKV
jgi:integrase